MNLFCCSLKFKPNFEIIYRETIMDLSGKSYQELKAIAKKAAELAEALKQKHPSYNLAIENGVRDVGYNTTANGYINSYTGEAVIKMDNGDKWKAIGHKSTGNAYYADDGYIEFIPQFEI